MRVAIYTLFPVFVCLTAMGQAFTPLRPFIPASAGSSFTPPSGLNGLDYWWVATDTLTNATIVTNWVDRIQQRPMRQGFAGREPLQSTNGVFFSGSTCLSNTISEPNMGIPAGFGFMVATPIAQSGDAIAVGQDDRGIGYNTGPNLRYSGTTSGGPNTICPFTISNTMDVVICLTATNTIWYTNGAPCRTNLTGSADSIAISGFGWTGIPSALAFYKGYLIEFGMYTNHYPTQSDVDTLHKYFTNTYHYTP